MITIRNIQLEALRKDASRPLPLRIAKFLRGEFPEDFAGLDDATLSDHIDRDLSRARAWKLEKDWDLARFCWLSTFYGEAFEDNQPWIRAVLEDPDFSPTEKMDRLEHHHLNYRPSVLAVPEHLSTAEPPDQHG